MSSHWEYQGELYNPNYEDIDSAGFVYMITNKLDGRKYVGKKAMHARRTLPPLKGKKRKRKTIKESDWKTYTGSCQELNDDIGKLGIQNFTFEIISLHINRTENNYAELKLQIILNVLEARNANGDRIFYNRNIVRKFYPSEIHGEDRLALHETYSKMSAGSSE